MKNHTLAAALLSGLVLCAAWPALAQEAGAPPAPEAPAAPPPAPADPAAPSPVVEAATPAPAPCCLLAVGTEVTVEITEPLSSSKSRTGETFALKLAKPIMVGDVMVAPAGAVGAGEVIDAKDAGFGGRPGRLVLAARYVDVGDRRIMLRSLKLGGGGADNSGLAVGAVIAVGVVGAAVRGGGISYPAGFQAQAKVGAAITLDPITPEPAAPAATNP